MINKSLSKFKLKDELDKEREERLKEIKDKKEKGLYNQLEEMESLILNIPSIGMGGLGSISEEDKIKYNQELQTYIGSYEYYLHDLYDYHIMKSLTTEFEFELNNDGTVPAEEIDIYFHFPDGFKLYGSKSYPAEPEIPREPYKPRSIFDRGFMPTLPKFNIPDNYNMPFEKSNVSSPSIKKTNSYDVDISVRKLKHNKIVVLDKMYIVFENLESILNFKVDYEIRCSNVPQVVKGHVNFVNTIKKDGI